GTRDDNHLLREAKQLSWSRDIDHASIVCLPAMAHPAPHPNWPQIALTGAATADQQARNEPLRTKASLRQVVLAAVFAERAVVCGRWAAGRGRRVGPGPGVAWPKGRCSGCEPAAQATESFPVCPPGLFPLAAAPWASAWRRT